MKEQIVARQTSESGGPGCISRRQFLFYGAGAVSTLALSSIFGATAAFASEAKFAQYPHKKIASLSDLKLDTPLEFLYPNSDPTYAQCFLVKLGEKAGGGVGPDQDIVAFSSLCTHMGGLLNKSYNAEHKVAGPCPSHLSTFDLTRHGMVVAGHAVESLPQIVLEVKGNDVYATGVAGLIFGGAKNPGMK
ncbi:MAG: arsenate reductase (azurin) small subunit [bacterium]